MKNFLILALFFAFLSCSDDDDDAVTCKVSDFVGVWKITGGSACILNDADVLTITDKGNGKIYGEYTGANITSTFDDWTVTNCTFTGKVNDGSFINVTITGTLTNGKLQIVNKGTFLGSPVDCTENLTK